MLFAPRRALSTSCRATFMPRRPSRASSRLLHTPSLCLVPPLPPAVFVSCQPRCINAIPRPSDTLWHPAAIMHPATPPSRRCFVARDPMRPSRTFALPPRALTAPFCAPHLCCPPAPSPCTPSVKSRAPVAPPHLCPAVTHPSGAVAPLSRLWHRLGTLAYTHAFVARPCTAVTRLPVRQRRCLVARGPVLPSFTISRPLACLLKSTAPPPYLLARRRHRSAQIVIAPSSRVVQPSCRATRPHATPLAYRRPVLSPPCPPQRRHGSRPVVPSNALRHHLRAWRAPGPALRSHALMLPPCAPTQFSRTPMAPSRTPARLCV
ncbi:hypothetical protein DENSPDRAFT_885460 [Dentipellis sp. KUC8613]|nr:hypothetical protein DENSPDRAFT_885460 [Dentipellis sp. KUC8613]